MIELVDHRGHRESIGDVSVFSVRCLCDLYVKLYALLFRRFGNDPMVGASLVNGPEAWGWAAATGGLGRP